MHPSVAFDDVARALSSGGSGVHPSEAHGCLCGAFCARREYSFAEWIDEILPGAQPEGQHALRDLFDDSVGVLARAGMEFEPLLPDDADDLGRRVEALGTWCEGFLYGFGAAGATRGAKLPPVVSEALGDLAKISQAGVSGSGDTDEEEAAYAELVEFIRAAVQLVFDELSGLRRGQPVSTSTH